MSKVKSWVAVSMLAASALGLNFALAAEKVDPFAWVAPASERVKERSWPTAAKNPAVKAEIVRHRYTEEESRNLQTVLEIASGTGRHLDPERWRAPGPPSPDAPKPLCSFCSLTPSWRPHGYYILHEFFGERTMGRNGWYNPGLDQVKTIEDIIVKGNRVVAVWVITGPIVGPFFGFEGHGQRVDTREDMDFLFDDAGKIKSPSRWSGTGPWSGEDLVLYEQLGGKLALPTGRK